MSLDVHWHDTYFVVAHFHFIMVGGTLTAFLAALHYWFPKMTGRMYPERLGLLAAALVFAGFFVTFFPQFLLGNGGMPRRYYDYVPSSRRSTSSRRSARGSSARRCSSRSATCSWRSSPASAPATTRGARAASSGERRSPPPKHNFDRRAGLRARIPTTTPSTARSQPCSDARAGLAEHFEDLDAAGARGAPRHVGLPRRARCSSSRASSRSTRRTASSIPRGFGVGVEHNTLALGHDQHGRPARAAATRSRSRSTSCGAGKTRAARVCSSAATIFLRALLPRHQGDRVRRALPRGHLPGRRRRRSSSSTPSPGSRCSSRSTSA